MVIPLLITKSARQPQQFTASLGLQSKIRKFFVNFDEPLVVLPIICQLPGRFVRNS